MEVERGPPPGQAAQPARLARAPSDSLLFPVPPAPHAVSATTAPTRGGYWPTGALPPAPRPLSLSRPSLVGRFVAPAPPPTPTLIAPSRPFSLLVPTPPLTGVAARAAPSRREAPPREPGRGAPALAAGRHEYLSDCWGHEPCGVHCHTAAQDEDVAQLCGYVKGWWLWVGRWGGRGRGAVWMDLASGWHCVMNRVLFDAASGRLCWRCGGCRGCLTRSQRQWGAPGSRAVRPCHPGRGR